MTPKLRAQLDQIDEMLSEEDGAELSAILSALRGPDDPKDAFQVKAETTNVIRREAFPKTFTKAGEYRGGSGWEVARTNFTFSHQTITNEDYHYHFRAHVNSAARALGLIEPNCI